ncbi:cyclic nucleotide-binding domain-containing protein, partial [Mesorhizobium sp.]|uniref:Crp/Fnr family transcriptional regulator n=1 Tax=Mesorhizobium sp. TaxID=1871066 RepID=UPI000FE2E411
GSPAFISRLCDADLAALTKRWHERSYRHNELIISHGDTGRDVFFLLEGRARVTLVSADGREIAYRDVEPGDIFGECTPQPEFHSSSRPDFASPECRSWPASSAPPHGSSQGCLK